MWHSIIYIIPKYLLDPKATSFKVSAVIFQAKTFSGLRKQVYDCASVSYAIYDIPKEKSIWYPHESNDLNISIRFGAKEHALTFIRRMSELKLYSTWGNLIEIEESPIVLDTLEEPVIYIYHHHYVKIHSSSPENSLAETNSNAVSEITNDFNP